MTEPALYLDGEPRNLTAAASDALTWLRFLQQWCRVNCPLSTEDHVRLARTIASLDVMLANAIMEFGLRQAQTPGSEQ